MPDHHDLMQEIRCYYAARGWYGAELRGSAGIQELKRMTHERSPSRLLLRLVSNCRRQKRRVSGHSDLCSSRIELEIILTLRRNVLPFLLVEGSGHPSPRGIAEVCKPDQANGLCTRLQSSSSQRWRCGTTARSRRTIASIIWDWTADQDSRSNSWRPGQAIVQAMA